MIFDQILSALREEARSTTQQEIADRAGLSQSHVGKILSGKSPVEKIQLGTFRKLFPDADIRLSGGVPDELDYEREAVVKWFFAPEHREERYALLSEIEQAKKNTESARTKSKMG
ncbi:MAG: helix-turn-helix transcriptional regulator [Victivallales bacterium]|nr:helix-turn-helix transcriptional regulator [Victivallales bacterium]